jgi:hypothetical protein
MVNASGFFCLPPFFRLSFIFVDYAYRSDFLFLSVLWCVVGMACGCAEGGVCGRMALCVHQLSECPSAGIVAC